MTEESKSPSPIFPREDRKQFEVPVFLPPSEVGNMQMFPVMYPVYVPNMIPSESQEQTRGAGIYAVPVLLFTGSINGIASNTLIPLSYNLPVWSSDYLIPTRLGQNSVNELITTNVGIKVAYNYESFTQFRRPFPSGSGAEGEEIGLGAQERPAAQRQVVVRRFQIAIQLDLLLILKLAAVIFLFNQDGSRQRLALLVFLASIVYLYQTGALAPLMQWLSQGMQRAAAPPQPPRQAVGADNIPSVEIQRNENAVAEGKVVNENRPAEDGNGVVENERDAVEVEGAANNKQWWGIVKEIQMIVSGFITSLLPGFHNVD